MRTYKLREVYKDINAGQGRYLILTGVGALRIIGYDPKKQRVFTAIGKTFIVDPNAQVIREADWLAVK